jgi:DNA-binding MarR family transcriptional regulator
MSTEAGQSHTLAGFPAAAVEFVNVMQRNRERIGQDAGLSPSELRALFRVAAEVSITPKQLAGYLNMTTAAVTFISSRLVDSGLLHRVSNPNDRRSLYLELTPLAHRMMLDIHRDFVALLETAASDLDPPYAASSRRHFSPWLNRWCAFPLVPTGPSPAKRAAPATRARRPTFSDPRGVRTSGCRRRESRMSRNAAEPARHARSSSFRLNSGAGYEPRRMTLLCVRAWRVCWTSPVFRRRMAASPNRSRWRSPEFSGRPGRGRGGPR